MSQKPSAPKTPQTVSQLLTADMFDENGDVIGIIVSTSVRRGRDFTVAPQILGEIIRQLGLERAQAAEIPARAAVASPVSLERSAKALSRDGRIAETYCIPR